jgi:hypothetical protein
MASVRAQVRRVLDTTVQSMQNLERPALLRILPVLASAQKEVEKDLRQWLASHSGETFTAARYKNALAVLNRAVHEAEIKAAVEHSLKDAAKKHIGPLSLHNVQREWMQLGTIFEGTVAPLAFEEADILAEGRRILWPRFESSAQRYAGSIGEKARFQLAVSRSRGETIDELTRRLQAKLPHVFHGERWDAESLARTECLVGDTLVDSAMVTAVHRRAYNGPVIEIITSKGRKFTTTPNHPMLARSGWTGANLLTENDYLICDAREKHSGSSGDPNVEGRPAKIGEIFDSLSAVGVLERRRTGKPDFHGDGIDGHVDIACTNGALQIGDFSALYRPLVERVLTPAALASSRFCPTCMRLLDQRGGVCICPASQVHTGGYQVLTNHRGVQFKTSTKLAGIFSSEVPSGNFPIIDIETVVSGLSSACSKDAPGLGVGPRDPGSMDLAPCPRNAGMECTGNTFDGLPRSVEFDRVLSVTVREFSGHVFNLSTDAGYFTIHGAYTGNTMNAAAEYQHRALVEASADDPKLMERWDAAHDGRLCPMCASLDGQVVALDEYYEARWVTFSKKRGMRQHYAKVGHTVAHVDCRCVRCAWRKGWPTFATPSSTETLARAAERERRAA